MSLRRWTIAVLAGIALVLIVGRVAASVYVDYRWYAVMSASSLWRLKALHTLALTGTSGAVSAAFVFLNLYAVRRSVVSLILPRRLANLEIGEEVPGHYLLGAVIALSVILGALLALPSEHWTTLALARYGREFGETDPYFEADLGFFMYSLPLENAVYVWALIAVLLVTAVVVFFYALTPSLRWEKGKVYVSNYVRRHMIVLGALLLMLLSWSYRLDAYDVLLSGSGVEGAFSFSDHYATIRVSSWLWVITAGAAVVVLWLGWIGQVRAAGGVVVSLLLASILLRQAAPPIVRRLASSGDPATREQPYMAIRADYSRRAYGIERLATGNSSVIFASLGEAANALSIWDPAALERAVTRMRGSTGVAHSVGWAVSPSGLEAVLPLRSFRQDESGQSDSWTVTRVAAYAADEAGDPVPLDDSGGSTARALPPVLIFPAASGYRVVTNSPSDLGAAELTSWLSRLAHAWSLQNFRLLGGRPAREEAHLMTHRDLRTRLDALVPFLSQGTTVLPLLPGAGHGDDTLYWVVDLYASAGTYPLSHRVLLGSQEQSYIQHAATAIVNAHTGRVRLVADSILDPLAESWVRVLPDLFTDWPDVPDHISAGVPPAGDAARVQAFVVARYGLRGEATRGGHLAWPDGADSLLAHDAPPMLVFPQDGGSLGMTEPVLDSNDRAVGVIAAVGRGQSVNYWIPVSKKQPRWAAMIDRLDRSSDSASVSQRDLRIVHGKVRIVPLESGLAFVRPAYNWRQEAPPVLANVRALVGDTLVSGRTLAIAIGLSPRGDMLPPLSTESFRVRVAAMYEEMRAALARGDLTGFAQAYKALGDLVARAEP